MPIMNEIKTAPLEERLVDLMIKTYGERTEEAKRDMPSRLRAIVGADKNNDGKIDSAEYAAAARRMYSPATIAGLQQLECKNPAKEAVAQVVAKDFTDNLNRVLQVLATKKPGLNAAEYSQGAIKQINDLIAQMNDKADENVLQSISPVGAQKLVKALTQMQTDLDKVAISTYEQMNGRGELGKLPSQALPLTPQDLCSIKRK